MTLNSIFTVHPHNGPAKVFYTPLELSTWVAEEWDGKTRFKVSVGQKNVTKALETNRTELAALEKRREWLKNDIDNLKIIQQASNGSSSET